MKPDGAALEFTGNKIYSGAVYTPPESVEPPVTCCTPSDAKAGKFNGDGPERYFAENVWHQYGS